MVHLLDACNWAAEHGWGTWDKRVTWTHLNLWPRILGRLIQQSQTRILCLPSKFTFLFPNTYFSLSSRPYHLLPPTLSFLYFIKKTYVQLNENPLIFCHQVLSPTHIHTSITTLSPGQWSPHPETQILQGPASAVFLLTGWGVWPGGPSRPACLLDHLGLWHSL